MKINKIEINIIPENARDYKEYFQFLIDYQKEDILKNIEEQKKEILHKANKMGYNSLNFSGEIIMQNYIWLLRLIGQENETTTKNRFTCSNTYSFPYTLVYGKDVERINWSGWDRKNQIKIDEIKPIILARVENRINRKRIDELEEIIREMKENQE